MEGAHFIASALGTEIPSDATAPSPSGFETEKRDRAGLGGWAEGAVDDNDDRCGNDI